MRHARAGKKLGRDSAHRKALYSNLAGALIEHGRIETTEAKAKAVRPTSVSAPTVARRRFDQRAKKPISTTSMAAAPATATMPHGEGRTVSARITATMVSMREG